MDCRDIPDQTGRIAVVTGANSGLGKSIARELARAGASVTIAVRNTDKGEQAAADIRRDVASADLSVQRLDLADLASVRSFAEAFAADTTASTCWSTTPASWPRRAG